MKRLPMAVLAVVLVTAFAAAMGVSVASTRASPPSVTAISAGYYGHTCAIRMSVSWCWGYNSSGQLGNGNTTSTSAQGR